VLGRLPVVQAGAWVWDDIDVTAPQPGVTDALLQGCVSRYETTTARGVVTATMAVPRCVARAAGAAG
jgi:hypothetical protein